MTSAPQQSQEAWEQYANFGDADIDLSNITSSQVADGGTASAVNSAPPSVPRDPNDPLSPFPRFPPTPSASAQMTVTRTPQHTHTPDPFPPGSQSNSLENLLLAVSHSQNENAEEHHERPPRSPGAGLAAHPPIEVNHTAMSYHHHPHVSDDEETGIPEHYQTQMDHAYQAYYAQAAAPQSSQSKSRKRKNRQSFDSEPSGTAEEDEEYEEEMGYAEMMPEIEDDGGDGSGTMERERKAMRREIDALGANQHYDGILLKYFHLFLSRFTCQTTVNSQYYIRTDSLLAAFEMALHPTWNERKSVENGIRDGSWLPGGHDVWAATPMGTNKRMGSNMWGEPDSVQLKNLLLARRWKDGVVFGALLQPTEVVDEDAEGESEGGDGEWSGSVRGKTKRRRGSGRGRRARA